MAINHKGHTLIELLAIIAILVIIAGIVSFNLSGWIGSSDVEIAAKELAGEIRLLQQLAITENCIWEMRFSLDDNYYFTRYQDGAVYTTDHAVFLPDMVYWGDLNNAYQPTTFHFNYTGVPSSGLTIGLHDERDHVRYVIVAAVTGRVRISTIAP